MSKPRVPRDERQKDLFRPALAQIITSIKDIAATTIRTVSASGSAAECAVPPPPSAVMKRRAAVEPVIGHVKAEHRMDRNYLKGRDGDRINAVLAAAGYNFSLLLRWLAALLRVLFLALVRINPAVQTA